VNPLPIVDVDALDDIAALCARAIAQPFTTTELRDALFAPDQPARVRFDPAVGIVATVRSGSDGFVRLLAVDPASRRRGHSHALVRSAEADLDGTDAITIGADAPYFLFPGVPTTETALCYLLERLHYTREETNFNMVVDLDALPPDVGPLDVGTSLAPGADERGEISDWMEQHWSNWRLEVLRAFDHGSLLLARDDNGIAGFCAYDVNRSATLGPIASRPDLIGRSVGKPLLLGALHRMRERGYRQIEVLWVGPFVPYARVGGVVGSVFFVYRKRRTRR
jgi:mycothiol synthase